MEEKQCVRSRIKKVVVVNGRVGGQRGVGQVANAGAASEDGVLPRKERRHSTALDRS